MESDWSESPLAGESSHTFYVCNCYGYLVVFLTQTARSRFCNLGSLLFLFRECNEISLSGTRIHLCISCMGTGTDSASSWKMVLPEGDCSHPSARATLNRSQDGIALIGADMC